MTCFVRLAAYKPYGDLIGVVTEPIEISKWYQRQGDIPQLQVTWSPQQLQAPYLSEKTGPIEVAVQMSVADGPWREPRNGRFVSSADTFERVNDAAQVHKVTYEGYVSLLDSALVWTAGGSLQPDTDSDKRIFNNVPAGKIMYTLIQEAQSRGAISGVTLGFDGLWDSRGNAWSLNVARSFERTQTLWQVLQSFQQAGELEFWMEGRKLMLADPAQFDGYDRFSGDNPLYLRDQLVQGSPETLNWKDLANVALVAGKDGAVFTVTKPDALKPWGQREVGITASKVTEKAAADRYGNSELKRRDNVTKTLTREWTHTDLTPWIPGTDFEIGDWCLADTSDGVRQRIKIADANLTVSKGAVKVFVTLGSIRDDAIVRALKRSKAMDGTYSITEVGRNSTSPAGADKRVPVAPPGCTVTPITSLADDGHYVGSLQVEWIASTTDQYGDDISPAAYQVSVNCRNDTMGWRFATEVDGNETVATVGGLTVGNTYDVRVRAVSYYGLQSADSPTVWAQISVDKDPPPAPSAPIVSSRLAGLTILWDGFTVSGQKMPADLNYINVYITGKTGVQGRINPNADNRVTLFGLNPGDNYEATLTAVDFAGNESAPSVGASTVIVSVLDNTDFYARMARVMKWSDNLYPDPGWQDENLNSVRFTTATGLNLDRTVSPRAAVCVGATTLWLTPTGDKTSDVGWSPESKYLISWSVKAGAADVHTMVQDSTDTGTVTVGSVTTIPANTTVQVSQEITYADQLNNRHIGLAVDAAASISAVSIRKKIYSTLIEDGAITTGKLYADKVMADTLLGKTVVADFIQAGQIKSAMLATDALDFKTAKGLSLVSGTISTSENQVSGIWLRSSSNSLTAYSPSGNRTLFLDANSGTFTLGNDALKFDSTDNSLSVLGTVQSGLTAPYTRLMSQLDGSYYKSGLVFQITDTLKSSFFGDSGSGEITWTSPTAAAALSYIKLRSDGAIILQGGRRSGGTVYQAGYFSTYPGMGTYIGAENGNISLSNISSGSSSMTLSIQSDWTVHYAGSLRAIKQDISPLDGYWSILDLQPVYYRDLKECQQAKEDEKPLPQLYAGFIADEIAELAETRPELGPLLTYAPGQEERKLAGVAYDRVAAYLVPVVRELAERVKRLESQ